VALPFDFERTGEGVLALFCRDPLFGTPLRPFGGYGSFVTVSGVGPRSPLGALAATGSHLTRSGPFVVPPPPRLAGVPFGAQRFPPRGAGEFAEVVSLGPLAVFPL